MTDYNGLTQAHTRDNLGREIQLRESGAAGLLRKTTTTYEDANRRVITRADNVTGRETRRWYRLSISIS